MTWVSYAQNAEDVRLRRAFAGQPTGFYVDVGANNPVQYSVTKHFYESGWTGINVDPAPEPFALIVKDRTRDINLNVACSNQSGTKTFHAARGDASGLSSFTDEEVALHQRNGFQFDTITTQVTTLAEVCEKHVGQRVIDFLSIDVEGHEREVLEGAAFDRFRPRVIVIEATYPNTMNPTHEGWENLIVSHNYLFAVFDGLNRYYVRKEDEQLAPLLAFPPNLFDDYVPYIYKRRIDELEEEVAAYRATGRVLRSAAWVARECTKIANSLPRTIKRVAARRRDV